MDPLCTFIFAVIVIVTIVGIVRDISDILMERVPRGLDADVIQKDLQKVIYSSHDAGVLPDCISIATTKSVLR